MMDIQTASETTGNGSNLNVTGSTELTLCYQNSWSKNYISNGIGHPVAGSRRL